jgi:hypothetical protein
MSSAACGFCSTPLDPTSPLTLPCPTSSSLSPSSTVCPFRFCNRLCFSRSAKHHTLLCPSANPASAPLLKWAREAKWMALHALAQCASRVLLAGQRGEEEEHTDWDVVTGLAELGMEERWKHSFRSWVFVLFFSCVAFPSTHRELWFSVQGACGLNRIELGGRRHTRYSSKRFGSRRIQPIKRNSRRF